MPYAMTVFCNLFALIATALVVTAEDSAAVEHKMYNASSLQALYPIIPQFLGYDPNDASLNNNGRLLSRQSCSTGYGSCPNDESICCPLGGDCCSNRRCCASGYRCVIVDGTLGCCPVGQTCVAAPTTTSRRTSSTTRTTTRTTRTSLTTSSTTVSSSTTSSTTTSSSSTTTESSTTTPSPLPPTTVTTTEAAPPPRPVTVTNIVTVQGSTLTREVIITPSDSQAPATSSSPPTTTTSSSTPTGAIVGGVVGGIAVIALLFAVFMFFRRKGKREDQQDPMFDDLPQPTLPSSSQYLYDPDPQPPAMQQYGNSYFPSDAGGYPAPVAHPPQHPSLPEPYHPVSPPPGAFPVPMPASTHTSASASTPRDLYTAPALQPSHTPDGLPHYDLMDTNSNSYGVYSHNNNNVVIGTGGVHSQRNSVAPSPPAHQQSFGTRYDEPSGPSSSAYGMYNNAGVGAGVFSERNNTTSSPSAEPEPFNEKLRGRKIFG